MPLAFCCSGIVIGIIMSILLMIILTYSIHLLVCKWLPQSSQSGV